MKARRLTVELKSNLEPEIPRLHAIVEILAPFKVEDFDRNKALVGLGIWSLRLGLARAIECCEKLTGLAPYYSDKRRLSAELIMHLQICSTALGTISEYTQDFQGAHLSAGVRSQLKADLLQGLNDVKRLLEIIAC